MDASAAAPSPTDCSAIVTTDATTPALTGEALWEVVRVTLEAPLSRWAATPGDSLVIFDWDDTLLPTSVLTAGGHFLGAAAADSPLLPAAQTTQFTSPLALWSWRAELAACAAAGLQALRVAKQHGKVIVVTNATHGWVHATAARFMPQLAVELDGVPVISARSIYEPQGFTDPSAWKMLCFKRVLQCVRFDSLGIFGCRNLVSIGDSWHEREAVMRASTETGPWCYVKSLKLAERPSMSQLAQQMSLLAMYFGWLATHQGSLDLCIQDSWMGPICLQVPMPMPLPPAAAAEPNATNVETKDFLEAQAFAPPVSVLPLPAPLLSPSHSETKALEEAPKQAHASKSEGADIDVALTPVGEEAQGFSFLATSEVDLLSCPTTQPSGREETRRFPLSNQGMPCPSRQSMKGISRCRDPLRVRRDSGIMKRRTNPSDLHPWRRRLPQHCSHWTSWPSPYCFGA